MEFLLMIGLKAMRKRELHIFLKKCIAISTIILSSKHSITMIRLLYLHILDSNIKEQL
jgi:hypothetical protein